jgi:hypothetical protein
MPAFAGFDAKLYPGSDVLGWLSQNTNLEWCGYYLAPTPSHQDRSWMGKLAGLQADGWGVAPVFVGEQVIPPGSLHPSAAKGAQDGADAASLMTSEGFAPGAAVYLDLENGEPFPQSLQEYTQAWCQAVENAGFQPGVYCSHNLAAQVHVLYPCARVWAFKVPTTEPTPVAHPFQTPDPAGCGYESAFLWQHAQSCILSVPLAAQAVLSADLSSAVVQDPGAPDVGAVPPQP